MYYYTVNEGIVLSREVRKKCKTEEDAVCYLASLYPDKEVRVVHTQEVGLYAKCKELTEQAEDLGHAVWFVSEDEDSAKAGAIISAIECNGMWKLLMSEQDFDEWINTNVR